MSIVRLFNIDIEGAPFYVILLAPEVIRAPLLESEVVAAPSLCEYHSNMLRFPVDIHPSTLICSGLISIINWHTHVPPKASLGRT